MVRLLPLALLLCCATPSAAYAPGPSASHPPVSDSRFVELGDIDGENVAAALVDATARAKAGERFIPIRISSDGGSVFAGLEFIKAVVDLQLDYGVKTVCIVDSHAYSMAAVILESPACDVRLARPYATIMIHHASVKVAGSSDKLDDASLMLKAVDEAMLGLIADRMHLPFAELLKRIDHRDYWLSARGALAAGALDALVE